MHSQGNEVGRSAETAAMERNLRLVPLHEALASVFPWMPIFVLFTRREFGLDGALALGSIYYLSVVALEVPSGWLSDRVGRVTTLRVAAAGFVAAQVCFLFGSGFAAVAAGQILLAVGFASLSGTDVTFHYDTLEALDRHEDFADRRARVESVGYTASAVSALGGGALGLIDLRLAFAASLIFALALASVSMMVAEPPRSERAGPIGSQLARCLRYLDDRVLGWIFLYGTLMVTLEHVAFTNSQPWLTEVLGLPPDRLGATPVLSGFIMAAIAAMGAVAARLSAPIGARFGTTPTLLGLAGLSAVIVSAMASSFHWTVIGLLVFRSAQGAMAPVLIGAEVAPRVAQQHRATLLSLNSLAGRLGYGVLLAAVGAAVSDRTDPRGQVDEALLIATAISWAMVAVLVVSARSPMKAMDSR